jgi:hypothetical protein
VTVSVSDDGVPALSSSRSFRVYVTGASGPSIIVTPPGADGQIQLSFAVVAGHHYRVEYKEQLGATAWTALPGSENLLATGSSLSVNDNITGLNQRFYRVVQLD